MIKESKVSFSDKISVVGTLYLVSTPIGNLEDITFRALRILREVDLILCEDTRQTKKLLDHYKINKPLESFFEGNEEAKIGGLIKRFETGQNLALVTDAGTPSVSDPGYRLVVASLKKGIKIMPVPGPSAAIAALSVSGLPTDRFIFVGFLPQKEGRRKNLLEELKGWEGTIIAYESPNRLLFALEAIREIFGNVTICVAREMTKVHEEFFRGKISEALESFKDRPVKGEVTLIFSSDPSSGSQLIK